MGQNRLAVFELRDSSGEGLQSRASAACHRGAKDTRVLAHVALNSSGRSSSVA
jgi:hypothetical protein